MQKVKPLTLASYVILYKWGENSYIKIPSTKNIILLTLIHTTYFGNLTATVCGSPVYQK